MTDIAIEYDLNGRIRTETVAPHSMLVDHLRDHCDLKGAKIGLLPWCLWRVHRAYRRQAGRVMFRLYIPDRRRRSDND